MSKQDLSRQVMRQLRLATNVSAGVMLLAGVVLFAGCGDEDGPTPPVTPPPGPEFQISEFPTPSECQACHPNHFDEWGTSMHAYAFVDPAFFALNFAEQTRTAGALGQFCIECHSPIGPLTDTTTDFFEPESMPEIVRAGVSCMVCHFMTEGSPGATEAGTPIALQPGDTFFGPLPDSENTFHKSVQNLEFENSSLCRSCHNLTINGIAMESTFDEWEESIYASRGDSHCQDCHMESYSGQAAVGGPTREVHRHWFTGVDIALTDFPGRSESVGRTQSMLEKTAQFEVVAQASAAEQRLDITATVINRAPPGSDHRANTGHSLPTGTTFSRQMWIEVTVTDANDTVLYQTGDLDANGDLRDENSVLEPGGDADLVIFGSKLHLPPEGGTVFTATGITENLIPTNQSRSGVYAVSLPPGVVGPLRVEARLLYRAFPPYKAREAGLASEQIDSIPIFEMNESLLSVPIE